MYDFHTTTVEGAAAFARQHDSGYPEDRPSAAELAEMAEADRMTARLRQQREDAARARGQYVPSFAMNVVGGSIGFALARHGVFGAESVPTREGVFHVHPIHPRQMSLVPAAVEAALTAEMGDRVQFQRDGQGGVWVQVLTNNLGDPFLVDGVGTDEPPF
jgi:hypothetical protein